MVKLKRVDVFIENVKDESSASNSGFMLTMLLPFAVAAYTAYIIYYQYTTPVFTSQTLSIFDPEGNCCSSVTDSVVQKRGIPVNITCPDLACLLTVRYSTESGCPAVFNVAPRVLNSNEQITVLLCGSSVEGDGLYLVQSSASFQDKNVSTSNVLGEASWSLSRIKTWSASLKSGRIGSRATTYLNSDKAKSFFRSDKVPTLWFNQTHISLSPEERRVPSRCVNSDCKAIVNSKRCPFAVG
jgi:hypothetical protein